MKLEPVLNKFSEYNNPSKNVTILRHNFLRIDSLKARVFTILLQKRKKQALFVNSKIFETPSLKI